MTLALAFRYFSHSSSKFYRDEKGPITVAYESPAFRNEATFVMGADDWSLSSPNLV